MGFLQKLHTCISLNNYPVPPLLLSKLHTVQACCNQLRLGSNVLLSLRFQQKLNMRPNRAKLFCK